MGASQHRRIGWARLLAAALLMAGLSLRAAPLPVAYAATTDSYTNPAALSIPDSGPATPYPSVISVNDPRDVVITDVVVNLVDLSHTFPADLELLLLSPAGTGLLLMAGNGGGADVAAIDLGFANGAPAMATPLVSGVFSPDGAPFGVLDAPAPPGPYAASLAAFNGQRPDGDWQLFVFDAAPLDTGSIAGGWALQLTTEFAGISVTPITSLVTSESGAGAVFEVVLLTQPVEAVFIPLSSSDPSEGTLSSSGLTFTPANWDIPQTVFVVPADDSLADGPIAYSAVTGPAISADPVYDGRDADDVNLINADNDTAGIVVGPPSPFFTTEGGGMATFQVQLQSEPTAPVSIPILSGDPGEGLAAPASLTFTPADWNLPQTVTVTGQDDDVVDSDIFYSVAVGPATSADPLYDGMSGAGVGLFNFDDDSPGVEITPLFGITDEAGAGFALSVRLRSEPLADVLIGLASSDASEGTVSAPSMTFTPANWDLPQTVTVSGLDDAVDDGPVTYFILTSASSADPLYNNFPADDVLVLNFDDDGAGISVSPAGVTTSEAGAGATFSVVLDSQPTANVTLPLSSGDPGEAAVTPASLTFTPADWDAPQQVTVTGVNDDVDDGDQLYLLTVGPGVSADPLYAGLLAFVIGTNTDDDSFGVSVSPTSGLTTSEAGASAAFSVVLDSQPLADVTVALDSSDPSEGLPNPPSLTFTPADWDTPQQVTVTGQDDSDDDGDRPYTIITTVSSADPLYNGAPAADVALTNLDDDVSSIIVELAGDLTTSEAGGSASFTVRLGSTPSADVSFSLSSSDTSEGTVAPASLTFTPATWDLPQTVTITGVNDNVDDGDIAYSIVTGAATSGDPRYNGLNPADAPVTNLDNDTAGLSLAPASGITTEAGGAASFSLALTSEPTADVTIPLSSSDTGEGSVAPASLTFTPANWATPQTATMTGVDDAVDDGNIAYSLLTGAAASADPVYNGLNGPDAGLTNIDDDGAGITVSPLNASPTEAGGTGSFTVVLDSQPTDNVVINLSSSDLSEGTIDIPTLTFSPANWDVEQTVTVTGVDDQVDDGEPGYSIVLAPAISNDPLYDGSDPVDVAAQTDDDDAAGVTVAPTGGRVTTEAGGTASFTVVLTSEPTDNVSIGLSSSDTTEGTVSPASLSFTPANWNTPRTVTLTGVDDDLDDGDQNYQIITAPAVSGDANYNGQNPANVAASNSDNDTAGISVTPTSGLFTSEAGGTATFSVVLNSRPAGDVSIGLSSSDTTEGTVSSASLSFTPAGWNTPQTVTLTGINDNVDDGNIVYSIITSGATSSDPAYAALNPADVAATNTDDDTAGIVATPAGGLFTSEAGGTAGFTVALSSEPTDDVTIAVSSGDTSEGTVSPASLSFSALNWNVPRPVVVTGVDDNLVDGNQAFSVSLDPSSGDPRYDSLGPATVAVTNTDDEPGSAAGELQFSAATYSVGEQGGALVVVVRRVGGSSGQVTVQYGAEDQTAAAPGDFGVVSGTLTWAAGDTADKSFSVPIVDDGLAEGAETFRLVLSAPTGGAALGSPAAATATINDNDVQPFVRFSAAEYSVREVDGAAVITVVRGGSTAASLSVEFVTSNGTATAPGDYTSSGGTLLWGAGDTTPRSFTVNVRTDTLNEPEETVFLTLRNPSAGATLGSPSSATLRIANVANLSVRIYLPLVRR